MKLVDILARELKEWPEGAVCVDQSAVDREVYTYDANMRLGYTGIFLSQKADKPDAEVYRAQWQAVVDALKAGEEFVSFDFSGPVLDYGSKEWTGEGLPPVGIEFEWRYGDLEWKNGEALYIGSVYVILKARDHEQHYYLRDMQFRPTRTPEQIAAEEREEAIKQFMQIGDIYWDTASALYDAGARLPGRGAKA